MTYSLHIHRRADLSERGDDITLAEWLAVCETDPSLDPTGVVTARNPRTGEVIEIRAEGMARWDGPVTTWLTFDHGTIRVDGADDHVIAKACEIAARLGARVQGDEGEFYDEDAPAS